MMTKTSTKPKQLCVKTKFLIGSLSLILCVATGFYAYKTFLKTEEEIFYLPAQPTQEDVLKWYCKVYKLSKVTCDMILAK